MNVNDDRDLEQRLEAHLQRRAGSVHTPPGTPGAAELRHLATERAARTHRRRVAAMSLSGAAAVALVVGLVLNAQAPQEVRTLDDFAAAPAGGAGVATGSSTGSATGSAKGWRGDEARMPGAFRPVTLRLPGAVDESLSNAWATRTDQGDGRDAPQLAVLADVRPGAPVRAILASPQDTEHLSMGSGGRELTLAGRPARAILVGDHAWQKVIWSMDEDTNVLVQAHGLDLAEIEQLLTTLEPDGDGGWSMDPGTSGLEPVETTPPTSQTDLYVTWMGGPVDQPTMQTTLKQVDGGSYELWAALFNQYMSHNSTVSGIEVTLPDGSTSTGLLTEGRRWAHLSVLDPTGTVLTVERYHWTTDGPDLADPSPAELLRTAAGDLFQPLDDATFADLLEHAVRASRQDVESPESADEAARAERGLVERSWADPEVGRSGARAGVTTTTVAPTSVAPTTMPPTTVQG